MKSPFSRRTVTGPAAYGHALGTAVTAALGFVAVAVVIGTWEVVRERRGVENVTGDLPGLPVVGHGAKVSLVTATEGPASGVQGRSQRLIGFPAHRLWAGTDSWAMTSDPGPTVARA